MAPPPTFYVMRLFEFSLIFVFSALTFFISKQQLKVEEWIVRFSAVMILLFYTVWSAYQSRYIIACIPLLIVLGVGLITEFYGRTAKIQPLFSRVVLKSVLILIVILIFTKAHFVNTFISFPNDLCYF